MAEKNKNNNSLVFADNGYLSYIDFSKLSFADKLRRRLNIAKAQFDNGSLAKAEYALIGGYDPEDPNLNIGIVNATPVRATPQLILLSVKLMETINKYWKNLGKLKIRLGGNGKYASGILTKPGTAPTTFNGQNINYITSPKGGNVTHKFYTDQGSEYILTKDGFARRVKSSHANTGGADAGLHEWNKGATRFLDSDELGWSYQAWTDRTKPLGFSEKDGIISLVTKDNGKWRYVMRSELRPNAVKNKTIKDGIILSAYTTEPKVGKWILEYGTNPTGEINWFHPGSQVAFIEGLKQGGKMNAMKFKSGGQIRKMLTAAGGPIYWLRKRLYNNIEPFGYNDVGSRLIDAIVLNKNEHDNFKGNYSDPEKVPAIYQTVNDLWREYLHIPEEEGMYSNGKYKIKNNGNGTFSLPFESMKDIMQAVNSSNKPLLWGLRGKLGNSVVGEYDVHRGYDKNGDYLKYIDHWRINPYDVKEDKKYGLDDNSLLKWYFKGKDDASFGLGTPVEIQGKYYLDDIYNVKGKDRGGHYLPEVVVTGKKKQGGKMDIIKLFKEGGRVRKMQTAAGGGFTSLITTPVLPNIKEIRRRLYNGINPAGYQHIPERIWDALNKKKANRAIYRDDLWATYLQIPEEERHSGVEKLQPAKYKPSMGNISGDVYRMPLNEEDSDVLIQRALLSGLGLGKNMVDRSLAHYFGDHTVGKGHDKKGEYISYYDKYDLNQFAGGTPVKTGIKSVDKWLKDNTSNIDLSMGIGKPFEIYDRIYLDDYYGVPEKVRGGNFLPEITVTGKKK